MPRISIIISSIVILLLAIESYARRLDYKFFMYDDYVKVELCTNGNNTLNTKFLRPVLMTLENQQDENIKTEIDGVKNITSITRGDYITLFHQPNSKVCLSFKLNNLKDYPNLYFYKHKDNFLFLGNYVLPTIDDKDEEIYDVSFIWMDYTRPIISNFGKTTKGKKLQVQQISKQSLDKSFFIGGNFDTQSLGLKNNAPEIIFFNNFAQDKKEIISDVKSIIQAHDNFFKPMLQKDYFIFLNEPQYPFDYSGVRHEAKNFSYQALTLGEKVTRHKIQEIIAHEHIHKWIGGWLLRQDVDLQQYNAWFIEGITCYYAAYLNYKSGLWSLEDYLKNYNDCLLRYFSSPLQKATLDEINKYYSTLQNIAYLKGQIIGHELDLHIRKITKNKTNLDDYIKYLLNLAEKDKNFCFSLETLKKTLDEFTKHDNQKFIEEKITNAGINIESKTILDGKAKLIFKEMPVAKYDFDLFNSVKAMKVTGLKEGSNGYRNGLRNGQQINAIWYPIDKSQNNILTLEIIDNNTTKIIKLPLELQKQLIPQYVPVYSSSN